MSYPVTAMSSLAAAHVSVVDAPVVLVALSSAGAFGFSS
jgi:hypothetical protein